MKEKAVQSLMILISAMLCFCVSLDNRILFEDALDGSVNEGWIVEPDSFITHPQYGTIYHLKCDDVRLDKDAPWIGEEGWENYRIEVEILIVEKKGFVGLDYHMQNQKNYGNNFHFSAWRDTINLQSMGMWGTTKGSWKLWPVSQRQMRLEEGKWIKFRIDAGRDIANVYHEDQCIYTIYDIPFSNGGIRFWASYYGSAYFRNLRITQLDEGEIKPVLSDIWKKASQLNVIRDWQVTELKPGSYAESGLTEDLDIKNEKWFDVKSDRRGVINLSAVHPRYTKSTVLARTNINSSEKKSLKAFLTYTDRFRLWCNGEEIFHGPDRNWFNPEREKHGNSRLIPDQYEVNLPLKSGKNEIIIRSEVMEDFGWGFWMRTE